jgi:hypothetical protein
LFRKGQRYALAGTAGEACNFDRCFVVSNNCDVVSHDFTLFLIA